MGEERHQYGIENAHDVGVCVSCCNFISNLQPNSKIALAVRVDNLRIPVINATVKSRFWAVRP